MPLHARDAEESRLPVFVTNVNAAITIICVKTASGEVELLATIKMIMTSKSTLSL
jgi:hypothetical protein